MGSVFRSSNTSDVEYSINQSLGSAIDTKVVSDMIVWMVAQHDGSTTAPVSYILLSTKTQQE